MWGVYGISSEQVLAVWTIPVPAHINKMSVCLHQSVGYQSNQQAQALGWFFHDSICFSLSPAQALSKTLHREWGIGSSRSFSEPITEALRREHRGNDFLFRSIRKEYVSVSGFGGAESNLCKLWDEQTELSSCPFTWSHRMAYRHQWFTWITPVPRSLLPWV